MSRPVQSDGGEPAVVHFAKWSWTPDGQASNLKWWIPCDRPRPARPRAARERSGLGVGRHVRRFLFSDLTGSAAVADALPRPALPQFRVSRFQVGQVPVVAMAAYLGADHLHDARVAAGALSLADPAERLPHPVRHAEGLMGRGVAPGVCHAPIIAHGCPGVVTPALSR